MISHKWTGLFSIDGAKWLIYCTKRTSGVLLAGMIICSCSKNEVVQEVADRAVGRYVVQKYELYSNKIGYVVNYPYRQANGDEVSAEIQLEKQGATLVSATTSNSLKHSSGQVDTDTETEENIEVRENLREVDLYKNNMLLGNLAGEILTIDTQEQLGGNTVRRVLTAKLVK
jgi:hypothetical protein